MRKTHGTAGPDVVVFVMDTTRGAETVPADPGLTPNLATIAEEGTEYTQAFSTAPWTLPSHASMFTGTYPTTHGAHSEHTYLDDSLPTLAETFRDAGYETVGVSNNVWVAEEFGLSRGFDTFAEYGERTDSWSDSGTFADRIADSLRHSEWGGATVERVRRLVGGTVDDGASRTVEWVDGWLDDRDGDAPFLLFANCIEPHLEYRPPPRVAREFLPEGWSYDEAMTLRQDPREFDVGEFDYTDEEWAVVRALYRAEIAYLDEQVGRLRRTLETHDEWEDTVVVLVSDHGENVGEYGFLGHQYSLYDTVLHVPLVVRGGPFDGDDVRSDRLIQTADLAPTLLDVAGIEAPRVRDGFQALSFHPEYGDEARTEVFAEYMSPRPPLDVLEETFDHVPERIRSYHRRLRAVRTAEHKFVRGSDGSRYLYDLTVDPGETDDLSEVRPARAAELEATLDRWLSNSDRADVSGSVTVSESTQDRLAELGYL